MTESDNARSFTIAVDTREQRPYTFQKIGNGIKVQKATLQTGDYSLVGLETSIAVERKSLSDCYGTFGKGRQRFERELERMSKCKHAAVVIEADWETIVRNPPRRSKLNPKTIFVSAVAWSQRYNVHFWACPNRAFAEKTTFRILERFFNDFIAGK